MRDPRLAGNRRPSAPTRPWTEAEHAAALAQTGASTVAPRPPPKKPLDPDVDTAATSRARAGTISPRALAITVLARVAATDGYLNVVLDSQLEASTLKDPRDAGLVTELCYGATRRQLTLDFALQQVADRKLESIEDRVLAALRLGVYQLFYLRTPAHAAVGDTVQALKEVGLTRAAGFTNALLRKLSTLHEPPMPPAANPIEQLAVRESHPAWLVERWTRQFGPERAAEMLRADNVAPGVVLRTNTHRTTRAQLLEDFAAAGLKVRPTAHSSVGLHLEAAGRLEDVFGFSEGLWQVQDEAAQLVGLYAAIPEGARVLDACAAPGGKACHQAETHSVLALDVHANKLPKIRAEAARLGLTAQLSTRAVDCSKPLPDELGEFDAVLVDAPCSGLGTLRRHPELRYRRRPEDLRELKALQRSILESCQAAVAPGGLLTYAVCSTDPEEGADQIEMFLRSHPEFTAEPPPPAAGSFPTVQAWLRTLPGPEGFDGFFAARLRKLY